MGLSLCQGFRVSLGDVSAVAATAVSNGELIAIDGETL
jgi:hypothetical protein